MACATRSTRACWRGKLVGFPRCRRGGDLRGRQAAQAPSVWGLRCVIRNLLEWCASRGGLEGRPPLQEKFFALFSNRFRINRRRKDQSNAKTALRHYRLGLHGAYSRRGDPAYRERRADRPYDWLARAEA